MRTKTLSATLLLLPGAQWLAAGQASQGDQVPLRGCDALACWNTTTNSICSSGNQQNDVTQASLVGIAAEAVRLGPEMKLSLTMIEEGRTIFGNAPGLEAYERTLYVGAPASLLQHAGAENRSPAACILMLQYQSQTFPVPGNSACDKTLNGTTGCVGILDQNCQDRFASFIRSFSSNTTDCVALASHVTTQLRSQSVHICNYYSNLITATGASLLNTSSENNKEVLTQDGCRPTLPQSNSLYRVSSIQTVVKSESVEPFGGKIFGGRQSYTPVITAVYGGTGEEAQSVQFACIQTLSMSGKVLEKTSASMAMAQGPVSFTLVSLFVIFSVAILL